LPRPLCHSRAGGNPQTPKGVCDAWMDPRLRGGDSLGGVLETLA